MRNEFSDKLMMTTSWQEWARRCVAKVKKIERTMEFLAV